MNDSNSNRSQHEQTHGVILTQDEAEAVFIGLHLVLARSMPAAERLHASGRLNDRQMSALVESAEAFHDLAHKFDPRG